jgi:hypothetical protein
MSANLAAIQKAGNDATAAVVKAISALSNDLNYEYQESRIDTTSINRLQNMPPTMEDLVSYVLEGSKGCEGTKLNFIYKKVQEHHKDWWDTQTDPKACIRVRLQWYTVPFLWKDKKGILNQTNFKYIRDYGEKKCLWRPSRGRYTAIKPPGWGVLNANVTQPARVK